MYIGRPQDRSPVMARAEMTAECHFDASNRHQSDLSRRFIGSGRFRTIAWVSNQHSHRILVCVFQRVIEDWPTCISTGPYIIASGY